MWLAATILLGAGSERLSREPKRELALGIVQVASALIDQLLREFPHNEMNKLRTEMAQESALRFAFDVPAEEVLDPTLKDFVATVIDAYEFSLLGFPIRIIFEELGNVAGQTVLRPSVSSVQTDDIIENLVARVWSSEIDAAKSKTELLAAVRALPPSAFLRHTLSSHFMTRVFWNHWQRNNRLALLDAAVEAVQPLSGNIDKGRIQRMMEGPNGDQ